MSNLETIESKWYKIYELIYNLMPRKKPMKFYTYQGIKVKKEGKY